MSESKYFKNGTSTSENASVFHQNDSKDILDENLCFGRRKYLFTPNLQNKSKSSANFKRKKEAMKKSKSNNDVEFRYGNYHQYYGYRNQGTTDSRLLCMKTEWFKDRDVLDIGCNAGHLTLALAKQFSPRSMVGVDIDGALVKMAMRNVRHYVSPRDLSDDQFPLSLALSYGPVAASLDPKGRYPNARFPFNVQFLQCNFVLPDDEGEETLGWLEPHFDTALCLSLTKWVHLNWGDEGVRRLFRRCHAQLRPGGCLLLEAQDRRSYARRRKMAPECLKNYQSMRLFPEMFNEYLLKEVGFESCELVDVPAHSSKGFSRPIYLFTKKKEPEPPPMPQSRHVIYHDDSDSHCEYSDVEPLSD